MKTIITICLTLSLVCIHAGCTPATQPVAREAMQTALATDDSVVHDLAAKGKYSTMMHHAAVASNAVDAHDAMAARNAVRDAVNDVNDIAWLQTQHERARALMSQVQTYIAMQQGILNLWAADLKQASEAAKVTTTQPVGDN